MAEGHISIGVDGVARCWWGDSPDIYRTYHDTEWGFPVDDDTRLFEKICLEGFQSGLSWLTILRKRENFRAAFRGFDFSAVARFNERSVTRLLGDEGIIRHRGKIEATINNARRALETVDEFGSLATYFWSFEESGQDHDRMRPTSPASAALAKDLKTRGWRFVGPTTAYAFMQAMGLVNDHVDECEARAASMAARARFTKP